MLEVIKLITESLSVQEQRGVMDAKIKSPTEAGSRLHGYLLLLWNKLWRRVRTTNSMS